MNAARGKPHYEVMYEIETKKTGGGKEKNAYIRKEDQGWDHLHAFHGPGSGTRGQKKG